MPHGHSLCGAAAALLGAGVGGGIGASIAVATGGHGGASGGAIAGATVGGAALGAAVGALLARSYCPTDDPDPIGVAASPPTAATAAAAAASGGAPTQVAALTSAPSPNRPALVLRGVHFAPGKSDLGGDDARNLDDAAQVLARRTDVRIYVDGYTDSTEAPSQGLELAERRARVVADYLHARGVPARQLLPRGLGMTAYLASNATSEGRAQNRRVELVPAD